MAAPEAGSLEARIAELEGRLRALEEDNARLAEGQADVFLVGLLAEELHRLDDPRAVLQLGLERTGVLKGVPLCAACVREGDRLAVRAAFPAPPEGAGALVLSPSAQVLGGSLEGGMVLGGAECAEAGLPSTGPLAAFSPAVVVLLPAPKPAPGLVFVFADDAPASRLGQAFPILQRAVEAIATRLENLALVGELRALTAALDEKVALRTQALRASEERLRLALDAVAAAAWEWDLASGEVRWSEGLGALLSRPGGALTGTVDSYLTRVHERDRPAVAAALGRARAGGAAPERVVHRVEGAAEERWVELHARAAASPEGVPRRVVGVVLDVTDRHRLEEELRQAQRMESVGRLAGGIAHDFNNLLTTILGISEMLLAGADLGEPAREDLAAVRDAGRRAATLTRQLLAFSRRQRLEMRPVQLDEVVRAFAPMLSRLIGEEVAVRLDLAIGLRPVAADPSQLEQILMNLALNARDAMPGGGTLTIALGPGALPPAAGSAGPREAVRMLVTDTGAGMTPEVAARAFEPFFTTKARGRGTGLGLATVYGIVTQHDGAVSLRSAPGQGTTFEILLPAAPAGGEARGEAAREEPQPAGRGETVMVVDDEPLVREAIARFLVGRGYAVVEAGSAEEALAIMDGRPGPVDLLLTDVVMPGKRGPELARAFRDRFPGRPALLMSGYPEPAAGEEPLAGEYLEKPVTPDSVARAVRAALDAAGGSP